MRQKPEHQEENTFSLEFIHVSIKTQTCKVPQGYRAFYQGWKPEIDVALDYQPEMLSEDVYEVGLRFLISAKNGEEAAYTLEFEQARIFRIKHFVSEAQQRQLLNSYCPSLVFPYTRKAIADITQSAGFQALSLSPISFESLY